MSTNSTTTDALWLQGIGVFGLVPNQPNEGERDCLFRCISEALTDSKKNPHQIRKQVVAHMVNTRWKVYRSRIIQRWEWRVAFAHPRKQVTEKLIRREFAKRMSSAEEPGTNLELLAAADLYKFHFDYLVTSGENKAGNFYTFYSCRTGGCNVKNDKPIFIFYNSTQEDGYGRWELLRPIQLLYIQRFPLNRKIFGLRWSFPTGEFPEIDSDTRARMLSVKIATIAKARLRKYGITIITEDDADWPPEEKDNFIGCAAADFVPRPNPTRNPFRLLRRRLRTLFKKN